MRCGTQQVRSKMDGTQPIRSNIGCGTQPIRSKIKWKSANQNIMRCGTQQVRSKMDGTQPVRSKIAELRLDLELRQA